LRTRYLPQKWKWSSSSSITKLRHRRTSANINTTTPTREPRSVAHARVPIRDIALDAARVVQQIDQVLAGRVALEHASQGHKAAVVLDLLRRRLDQPYRADLHRTQRRCRNELQAAGGLYGDAAIERQQLALKCVPVVVSSATRLCRKPARCAGTGAAPRLCDSGDRSMRISVNKVE